MLQLDIDPVAIRIGSFSLEWDTLMYIMGIIVAVILFIIEAKRYRIVKPLVIGPFLLVILLGLFCARILFIIENIFYYGDPGAIVSFSGLRVYGFVAGVLITAYVFYRHTGRPFWQLCDMVTPALAIFLVILRVGCLMVGCCYGIPCAEEGSIMYTNPSTHALMNIAIYPTQLYHLAWAALAFIVAWALRRRFAVAGILYLLYISIYAAGDLAVRFFRANEPVPSVSTVIGVIIIVVSIILLIPRIRASTGLH
jgi:phosphatidylglycerol---prolipoprotein diacylglyceryl transferase